MKKLYVILFCLLLMGCKENYGEVITETDGVVLDEKAHHNIRHRVYLENTPYIYSLYEEKIDNIYYDYYLETYDIKSNRVWSITIKDLLEEEIPSEDDVFIYEDKIIVKAGAYLSVHDMQTGQFLWELETLSEGATYFIDKGRLYVLYCQDDFITAVSLENGKKILQINPAKVNPGYDKIKVTEDAIIVYKSDDKGQNAIQYTLEGKFVKKTNHKDTNAGSLRIKWDEVITSSALVKNTKNHLIDISNQTVWSEGVKGYGEQEWIELKRGFPTIVNELHIVNGNQSSKKQFDENAKVKNATINIGDSKPIKFEFSEAEFGKPTVIKFIQPILADYIYITLTGVEKGSLYKRTYITDIYTK